MSSRRAAQRRGRCGEEADPAGYDGNGAEGSVLFEGIGSGVKGVRWLPCDREGASATVLRCGPGPASSKYRGIN